LSVTTTNFYGKIYISDDAIATVAASAALDCYGVVDLASKRIGDNVHELFKKQPVGKGVKVVTQENRIQIDIHVVLKYGVSISAVAESLKRAVKYKVESFSGMIVDSVNINVVGVRV